MDWFTSLVLPVVDRVPLLRAVVALALVFFLPGFAWTFVFFKQLKVVERLALSFGLSIALVTLSIYALNLLFHVRIGGLNSVLIIIAITVVPVAWLYLKKFVRKGFSPSR